MRRSAVRNSIAQPFILVENGPPPPIRAPNVQDAADAVKRRDRRKIVKSEKLAAIVSWVVFGVTVACTALLAWYIPSDRARAILIFRSFNVELPASTQMLLAIPPIMFPIAAALAALLAVWMLVLCGVVYVTYRQIIMAPMVQLIESVSSPGGSTVMP
jgi:type II secretory pathway component PulF